MKNTVEITLSSIHIGECREVVTLGIDGKDHADEYLKKLKKKDPVAYGSIITRIKSISNYEHTQNNETFRHLGEGIYEFKRNTPKLIRLYAFYDEIEGLGQLILCANGGDKRQQDAYIQKAKNLKKDYVKAKEQPKTKLIYLEPKL